MNVLWFTSLRPIGTSKFNDDVQKSFLNSLSNIENAKITVSLTQFDDYGTENLIKDFKVDNHFINYSKKNLPTGKKYSNKIMLNNALQQYLNGDYEFLVYSTADIILPNNIFEKIKSNIFKKEFCSLIFPNILIKNFVLDSSIWPHYGIDLFIFKITKYSAEKLLKAIEHWEQFDWGINDNFYVSVCELLNIPIFNLYKHCSLLKIENRISEFKEDRSWQIDSWNENKVYFINFLKKNNLSLWYARASYYYLLIKIFNIKFFNVRLLMSYIIFYSYFPLRAIITRAKKYLNL